MLQNENGLEYVLQMTAGACRPRGYERPDGRHGAERARLDLITIGRSSIDLYGQQVGGRLEDMGSFAKYVGGSPTNTAIGASRLGLKTGLITRVGGDHMGRFIREELERDGVDVRGVSDRRRAPHCARHSRHPRSRRRSR
jgi:hypothetical protein